MGKVRRGILIVVALLMVIVSACSPTAETPANDAVIPSADTAQFTASATPAIETSTPQAEIPTEAPSATSTENIPTPTTAAPTGTLSLVKEFGYGTGYAFSPFGLQLSEDEKSLIATTSRGIFVFSADDLSPQLSIDEPAQSLKISKARNIRISRDGKLAAAFSLSEIDFGLVIRFWDLTSGKLLGEYSIDPDKEKDNSSIFDFDISADNRQVAALFNDGSIWVINVADGHVTNKLDQYVNNTQTPLWIEFDPTGKYAYYIFRDVSSTGAQSVGLNSTSWQETSKSFVDTLDFPWRDEAAFSPVLSDTGFKFGYFTNWGNRSVEAFDYYSLGKRFGIRRNDAISAIAFSPDGRQVVMGGTNPIQLEDWSVDTTEAPEGTFPVDSQLWSVAAASDGETFFGIARNGVLYKWQKGNAEPVMTRDGFWPVATGLEYTADGQYLRLFTNNTSTINNEVFEFDPLDGNVIGIYPNPYVLEEMKDIYPHSLAISPDRTLMAIVYFGDDKDIRLYDLANGKFIRKIPSRNGLDFIDFTPDGKSLIAYSLPDTPIQVLDLESGKVLKKYPVEGEIEGGVAEMRLSGDKSTLVLSGWGGNLKAYNTDAFEPIHALDESTSAYSFAISNDGSLVGILTWDGKLKLWGIQNNTILSEYDLGVAIPGIDTSSLAFSPDNRQLALATWDGLIRLFDVAP
jgi:WD40 repeat protein